MDSFGHRIWQMHESCQNDRWDIGRHSLVPFRGTAVVKDRMHARMHARMHLAGMFKTVIVHAAQLARFGCVYFRCNYWTPELRSTKFDRGVTWRLEESRRTNTRAFFISNNRLGNNRLGGILNCTRPSGERSGAFVPWFKQRMQHIRTIFHPLGVVLTA